MIEKDYDILGVHVNRAENREARYCNQNCIFCMENEGGISKEKNKPLPIEDLIEIVISGKEKLPKLKKIMLGGGEPTLYKHFLSLVERISNMNLEAHLVTNGTMTSDGTYLSELIKAGLKGIHISLHAPYEQIHDQLTRRGGSYKKVIKTLENALSNKLSVNTNLVVNKQNYQILTDHCLFLVRNFPGIKDQVYYHIVARGNAKDNYNVLLPKLSVVVSSLESLIKVADNNNVSLRIRDFPLCAINYRTDITRFQKFYFGKKIDDEILIFQIAEDYRYMKGTACANCGYSNKCLGLLKLNYEGEQESIILDLLKEKKVRSI